MFVYHLQLAFKSLFKRPLLTTLMIVLIAVGISSMMSLLTVIRHLGSNPISDKSDRLFVVRLDTRDLNLEHLSWEANEPPNRLTYQDAMYFMNAETPAFSQVMLFNVSFVTSNEGGGVLPHSTNAIPTTHKFFSMFNVPFKYGGAWTKEQDEQGAPLIVLTKELNERFFAGENSVGRQLKIDSTYVTVVGVLDEWVPLFTFYAGKLYKRVYHEAYLPFQFAVDRKFSKYQTPIWCYNDSAWERYIQGDIAGAGASECAWVAFWAEFLDLESKERYQSLMDNYVEDQKTFGRFERPLNNLLTSFDDWMVLNDAVDPMYKLFFICGFLFLVVCMVNMVSILLAKLLSKSSEMSLRWALGANKQLLLKQQLLEVSCLGLIGGVVGVALTYLLLLGIKKIYLLDSSEIAPVHERIYTLDWTMMLSVIAVSVFCTLLVGLYPIFMLIKYHCRMD